MSSTSRKTDLPQGPPPLSVNYVRKCWSLAEGLIHESTVGQQAENAGGGVANSLGAQEGEGAVLLGDEKKESNTTNDAATDEHGVPTAPTTAGDHLLMAVQILEGLLLKLTNPSNKQGNLLLPNEVKEMEVMTRCRIAELLTLGGAGSEAARKALEPALREVHLYIKAALQSLKVGGKAAGTQSATQLPFEQCIKTLRLAATIYRRGGHMDKALVHLDTADEYLVALRQAGDAAIASSRASQASLKTAQALVSIERGRAFFGRAVTESFATAATLHSIVEHTSQFASYFSLKKQESGGEKGGGEGGAWTQDTMKSMCHSAALSLGVMRVIALCSLSYFMAAQESLKTLIALVGALDPIIALRTIVEGSFGVSGGGSSSSGLGASPGGGNTDSSNDIGNSMQRLPSEVKFPKSTGGGGGNDENWIGHVTQQAIMGSLSVVRAVSTPNVQHPNAAIERCNAVVEAVESRMRELTGVGAAKTSGQAHINAEVRCLVGIKVVLYSELFLADLNKLDLSGASSKLLPLTKFVTLFHRHTSHYRPYLHLLIALLACYLKRPEEALEHLDVAMMPAVAPKNNQGGGTGDVLTTAVEVHVLAQLLHAQVCFLVRRTAVRYEEQFTDAMENLIAQYGADPLASSPYPAQTAGGGTQPSPELSQRVRLAYGLLLGIYYVEQTDYARGLDIFQKVVKVGVACFGTHSVPIVAQAQRWMGDALKQSGSADEKANLAVGMATEFASKCGDDLCLASCISWVLEKTAVVNQQDAKRKHTMTERLDKITGFYETQQDSANNGGNAGSSNVSPAAVAGGGNVSARQHQQQVDTVLAFLPGRHCTEYNEWMSKVSSASGGGGSGGSRKSSGALSSTKAPANANPIKRGRDTE